MDSHYDVIVVGAGLTGLPMAKTYIHFEPDVKLLILDDKKTVGGVWAKEKLYPGLLSNNLIGTYEFSDFPMHEGFGVKKEQHIPGTVIHEYFCKYAEKFDLLRRIAFQKKVNTAEKIPEGWRLQVASMGRNGNEAKLEVLTCSKLIIATGLTSRPNSNCFLGSEDFEKPIIQFASLPEESSRLLADPSIKHITVFGGGKAAYDTVYLFAKSGKSVTWVMRKSGSGPIYMAPAHIYLGPFRCWLEKLTATRVVSWFSPCIWGDADGFGYVRSLLHGTTVGRWIVDTFWKKLQSDLIEQTGIKKHGELKKLIPNDEAFWYSTRLGILNYPTNIHDLITEGQVKIFKEDLDRLAEGNKLKFEDGTVIETDAIITSTGWDSVPSIEFLPKQIHSALGIPSRELTRTQKDMWSQLDARADLEILERFPKLKEGPKLQHKSPEYSPWRLWRGVAPPSVKEKNIIFSGMIQNITNSITAEILGVWAYAYMNGKIPEPPKALSKHPHRNYHGKKFLLNSSFEEELHEIKSIENDILYEAALFNRFGAWRSPCGFSMYYPEFVFDGIAYYDLLVQDLGLNNWRKGWGFLGEVFGGSYGLSDYAGLADEWLKTQKG